LTELKAERARRPVIARNFMVDRVWNREGFSVNNRRNRELFIVLIIDANRSILVDEILVYLMIR